MFVTCSHNPQKLIDTEIIEKEVVVRFGHLKKYEIFIYEYAHILYQVILIVQLKTLSHMLLRRKISTQIIKIAAKSSIFFWMCFMERSILFTNSEELLIKNMWCLLARIKSANIMLVFLIRFYIVL